MPAFEEEKSWKVRGGRNSWSARKGEAFWRWENAAGQLEFATAGEFQGVLKRDKILANPDRRASASRTCTANTKATAWEHSASKFTFWLV